MARPAETAFIDLGPENPVLCVAPVATPVVVIFVQSDFHIRSPLVPCFGLFVLVDYNLRVLQACVGCSNVVKTMSSGVNNGLAARVVEQGAA